jgi:hypothetical protein
VASFTYANTITAEFGDRELAHLEKVIVLKLRRREPFHFAWSSDETARTSVWMQEAIPIVFSYQQHVDLFERTRHLPMNLGPCLLRYPRRSLSYE